MAVDLNQYVRFITDAGELEPERPKVEYGLTLLNDEGVPVHNPDIIFTEQKTQIVSWVIPE